MKKIHLGSVKRKLCGPWDCPKFNPHDQILSRARCEYRYGLTCIKQEYQK